MKIVVIGRTGRMRSEIVERLRQAGHNAAVADTRVKFCTEAPRDPGHTGRYLRTVLEGVAAVLRDQWLNRDARVAQLRQLLVGREAASEVSGRVLVEQAHPSNQQAAEFASRRTQPSDR